MKLDIGCGANKVEGCFGIDYRALPGVDLVWDLEHFPWPLHSNMVQEAYCNQVIEHIKPWLTLKFMDQIWRVVEEDGLLHITTPVANSLGYLKDPTHCNPCIIDTFYYFTPNRMEYTVYQPKPWKMEEVEQVIEADYWYPESENQFEELRVTLRKIIL